MAEEKKPENAAENVTYVTLTPEKSALLEAMIERERERRAVKAWLHLIGERIKGWAIVYAAIGTLLVAGREGVASLLHWIFGGPR